MLLGVCVCGRKTTVLQLPRVGIGTGERCMCIVRWDSSVGLNGEGVLFLIGEWDSRRVPEGLDVGKMMERMHRVHVDWLTVDGVDL